MHTQISSQRGSFLASKRYEIPPRCSSVADMHTQQRGKPVGRAEVERNLVDLVAAGPSITSAESHFSLPPGPGPGPGPPIIQCTPSLSPLDLLPPTWSVEEIRRNIAAVGSVTCYKAIVNTGEVPKTSYLPLAATPPFIPTGPSEAQADVRRWRMPFHSITATVQNNLEAADFGWNGGEVDFKRAQRTQHASSDCADLFAAIRNNLANLKQI